MFIPSMCDLWVQQLQHSTDQHSTYQRDRLNILFIILYTIPCNLYNQDIFGNVFSNIEPTMVEWKRLLRKCLQPHKNSQCCKIIFREEFLQILSLSTSPEAFSLCKERQENTYIVLSFYTYLKTYSSSPHLMTKHHNGSCVKCRFSFLFYVKLSGSVFPFSSGRSTERNLPPQQI